MKSEYSYLDFLKSKRSFIVKWIIFHFLGFFVNFFKIDFEFLDITKTGLIDDIVLFGTHTNVNSRSSEFWPFVKIIKVSTNPDDFYLSFNGIFYYYDISEFIAYSILIFIVLFFVYEKKYS